MLTNELFIPLEALAEEFGIACAAARALAGRAAIPLFRRAGAGETLLRRSDIGRLGAALAGARAPVATAA